MPQDNVRAINGSVNPPSLQECINWITAKTKGGDIAESSGRLAITSIKQLAAHVQSDEPQDDAAYVRDNLEKLADRWSRKNQDAKGDTARAYMARSKTALDLFFGWREDPAGFRFPGPRQRKPRNEGAEKSERKADKAEASPPSPAAAPQVAPPPPAATFSHRLKVGPDRFVMFDLPDNFTMAEWKRLVAHLLTLCDDFDPDNAPQVPGFAMTRNG